MSVRPDVASRRMGTKAGPVISAPMPFLTIAFPVFDPVAIAIGPFAIRWYALAYIGGIVIGWLYARVLIRSERLWGGPAPITLVQLDDFILWVTLGIILGGRTGYVLFYNPAFFAQNPPAIFKLWKGGMSFHGGFLGCVAAVMLFASKNSISDPVARRHHHRRSAPIGMFLGRIANFINSELWGRAGGCQRALGGWSFPMAGRLPRHPSQLYEAALEGILLFAILAVMVRMGALKRPGLILGSFIAIYALARIASEFFREPDPQLGFLWGGLTMGMLLSVPMIIAGAILIVMAWRRDAGRRYPDVEPRQAVTEYLAAAVRDQEADQVVRPDAGLALHGTVPDASAARLLRVARSARARGRFHHRARSQPDVRRTARAVGRLGVEGDRLAADAAAGRTRARPRHHDGGRAARAAGAAAALSVAAASISSRSIRCCAKSSRRRCRACATSAGMTASTRCPRGRRSFSPTNISTCCRSTRW